MCPEWWLSLHVAKVIQNYIKCSISALFTLTHVDGGAKPARVVVKVAEWWLGPTTTNQCGHIPDMYSV